MKSRTSIAIALVTAIVTGAAHAETVGHDGPVTFSFNDGGGFLLVYTGGSTPIFQNIGTVETWIMRSGGTYDYTPVLLEQVAVSSYILRGVGATKSVTTTQTIFNFDLVRGSNVVAPGYTMAIFFGAAAGSGADGVAFADGAATPIHRAAAGDSWQFSDFTPGTGTTLNINLNFATASGGSRRYEAAFNSTVSAGVVNDPAQYGGWVLTVPTLGTYDFLAGGAANVYYDRNTDLAFNAGDGDSTGNDNIALSFVETVSNGFEMSFYLEDFGFNIETQVLTLSGFDFQRSDGTLVLNQTITTAAPLEINDLGGTWIIELIAINGGAGGNIVGNLNSAPGGDADADDQLVLRFTFVPTPAALPAGLGLLALISVRRRRA